MFCLNKIFVVIFATLLVLTFCGGQLMEMIAIENTTMDVNLTEPFSLRQLNTIEVNVPYTIYTHRCAAGTLSLNRMACTISYTTSFPSARNVQDELRCPMVGYDLPVSHFEIVFSASTPHVGCFISEGGIGLGYIGVTINASNTEIFSYTAEFLT